MLVSIVQDFDRFHHPDPIDHRKKRKAMKRERQAQVVDHDEALLNQTGIRTLRRQPVFTTPKCFPPESFEQRDCDSEQQARFSLEPQHCYVCKQK